MRVPGKEPGEAIRDAWDSAGISSGPPTQQRGTGHPSPARFSKDLRARHASPGGAQSRHGRCGSAGSARLPLVGARKPTAAGGARNRARTARWSALGLRWRSVVR